MDVIVGQISSASGGQTQGIDQINQAIMRMDDVTRQNAALVEEAAASARSLQELSREPALRLAA
jgi:methyl-accepting chemotaxis protein